MALVLRKTITPKNVFLIKCMKGRKLSTAVYKKNTAPFFSAAVRHGYRRQRLSSYAFNTRKSNYLPIHSCNNTYTALFSRRSCPHIDTNNTVLSNRSFSSKKPTYASHSHVFKREYSKPCAVCCPYKPCCSLCKSCTCLPPPCNTPPRCLQYMTGYYYYPYGNWFCGPYHVAGACACVDGKCPSPCPKCCAACVCTIPNTGNENEKRKFKDALSAESPCQTLIELRKPQTGYPKFFDSKKTEIKKETGTIKDLPSIFTSMIDASQKLSRQCISDRKSQRRYPVLYNKFKRSYHTQAKYFNKESLEINYEPYKTDSIFSQKNAYQHVKEKKYRTEKNKRHFS